MTHLQPPAGVTSEQQRKTLDFVAQANREHLATRGADSELEARIAAYELAFRMQTHAPEVVDLAKKCQDYGVEGVIYTDIGRDGMLSGVNVDATVKLAQALTIPVIASGGLSNLADIERLCAV